MSVSYPPMLVTFAIIFVYVVYMFNVVIPPILSSSGVIGDTMSLSNDASADTPNSLLPKWNQTDIITIAVIFHILFILLVICFVRSVYTHPGRIPDLSIWREAEFGISDKDNDKLVKILQDEQIDLSAHRDFVVRLPVVERKKKDNHYRFCTQCSIYKPDRTHHCSRCNHCILRMDHHCPWISNCVGFMNYKFFLLFLVYALSCSIFVLATSFIRLIHAFRPVIDIEFFMSRDLMVILSCTICLFITIALGIFLSFHLYLTVNGMSTIELREKKNFKETRHRFLVAHLKFDKGYYGNLVHVLGPIYSWLLPIQPNTILDGTYCPISLQTTTKGV